MLVPDSPLVLSPKPSFLCLSTPQRSLDLLQVQQPGGFKRAARGARGVGLSDSRGAFFGAAFVRRVDGRFIWVQCSASSASRIHVRAMSIRISRTRAFGACAAIRWHSAARTLHLSAVSMAVPRRDPSHYFQVRGVRCPPDHRGAFSFVHISACRLQTKTRRWRAGSLTSSDVR
jgi:hypothetical protein